ncbi:MAG: hypothetical protein K9J13_08155, partial [Saprospiraceae bacterium]|nr:hypothetical protein [Saprospiraceae bacterium]
NTESLTDKYRLNNKYWNLDDYDHAYMEIKYTDVNEKKPCYSIPEKAIVFKKIIDKNNISVVIEDKELGLTYRDEFVDKMFDLYKQIEELYRETDREDKFIYPMELVDIMKFGLYIQIHYFELGNELIVQNADNPNAPEIINILRRNENTLVGNYCIYLGFIKQEKALTSEALNSYIDGINEYFPILIEKHPNANFYELKKKIVAMQNKTESQNIKNSLNKVLAKIESKSAKIIE